MAQVRMPTVIDEAIVALRKLDEDLVIGPTFNGGATAAGFQRCNLDLLFAITEEVDDRLSEADYWQAVAAGWVWQDRLEEGPGGYDWRKLFTARPGRGAMMKPSERAELAALTDPIGVFRGFAGLAECSGFSWTLDRGVAYRIATEIHALPPGPFIAAGTVAKSDVIAYFLSRRQHEMEIFAFPETVTITEIEEVA